MTITELQDRLYNILVAISDGDVATAGDHAHAMKSVAAQVGADQLSNYAKQLELDSKNDQANADYATFTELMKREMKSVEESLNEYIIDD